ncbi:MAG: DUF3386 family protein [Acidobacteriota bacterium]
MKNNLATLTQTLLAACCIALLGGTVAAQQTAAKEAKADPEAYALLKKAHDARQTFPQNFRGFAADFTFNDNGRITKGTLLYSDAKGVEVKIDGLSEEAKEWVNDQLSSMLAHRRGGDFAKGDGRYPLTFGEDDKNPLGRLLQLNDSMKSSYRVRDGQTVEVTRTMAGDKFTITVLETTLTEGGKFLPKHFTVTYFDAKTGQLKRTEMFTDAYANTSGLWVPASRRIIRAENGQVTARIIEISNVRLRDSGEQAVRK